MESQLGHSESIEDYLRLTHAEGVGPVLFGRLVKQFGSVAAALDTSVAAMTKVEGIGMATAEKIARSRGSFEAQKEIELANKHGATLGIFLPSFIFVAISNPLIPKVRQSRWAGALLDGVTVSSLGLMAAVTLQLGQSFLSDPLSLIIAGISMVLLMRFKMNSTWLITGGAVIGLASIMWR